VTVTDADIGTDPDTGAGTGTGKLVEDILVEKLS
jgi:hypothetical protein